MLRLALVLTLIASPAFAQSGWNSQNFGGGLTYYNGTGANQGWSGTSQNFGGDETYSTFTGPHGQQQTCVTQDFSNGGGQTYTTCQ